VWGGLSYLVFWRGESAWWFLLAVAMTTTNGISPWKVDRKNGIR
jgi:hypothetical protein